MILTPTFTTKWSLGDRIQVNGRPYRITGLSVAYMQTDDGHGHDVWYTLEDPANPDVPLYAQESACQEVPA